MISILLLSGCLQPTQSFLPDATLSDTEANEQLPRRTIFPTTDSWQEIAPGLEQRLYQPNNNALAQLIVLRIDPTQYTFRAHYHPGEPQGLSDWEAELTDAVAFVNANFFDPNYQILGLLISDGIAYGSSYVGRGGTFFVGSDGVGVRSNITSPYQGEPFVQAVQAFPMLVQDGIGVYANRRDNSFSRRTVVAEDVNGNILLMATTTLGLSLPELSAYLPTTDMEIRHALNLDGGGSTMMLNQASQYRVQSFDAVPAVLAIYRNES